MRDKILSGLARLHSNHPWKMITLVLVLTVLMAMLSTTLQVAMRWTDLLPEKDVRTVQFNKILDEFSTATSLVLYVQGDEQEIKSYAEAIVPKIKSVIDTSQQAEPLVKRIDYKTEIDFMRDNGLLLIKEKDLKNTKDIFFDPNLTGLVRNINNSMEKEYVGQQESISTRQKEDNAVMFLDGLNDLMALLQDYNTGKDVPDAEAQRVIDKMLFGEPFMLSYDEDALVLNIIPTFSLTDLEKVVLLTNKVQDIIDNQMPDSPVQAGLTGMVAVSRDEMVYSEQSLGITSVIAFVAILIMLILAFRMLLAPFMAILNLVVGIIWAMGVAAIVVGQLNMMTYMFTVILIGLGIDFAIHITTAFTEYRAKGQEIKKALHTALLKIGGGIITGGLTTAIAFLALLISSSRGMKEMGMVSGCGLLAIMVSTFLFLPSLLVLRERGKEKRAIKHPSTRPTKDLSFTFLGKMAKGLAKRPVTSLIIVALVTIFLFNRASNIQFDHNYMNIEPEGLTSIALQDSILEKFDLSMDYGLVLASSLKESREIAEKYRDVGSVAIVDDISLYLPSPEQQKARWPHIRDIQAKMNAANIKSQISGNEFNNLLNELDRLEMNVIEMQDMAFIGGQDKVDKKCRELVGNPDNENPVSFIANVRNALANNSNARRQVNAFQKQAAPYYQASVLQMCRDHELVFNDLPESIKDRYSNAENNRYLVTVFPAGNIWQDAEFLDQFSDDLERISPNATGMPPVFRALIDVIGRDGRNAALLTVILMFFILWFDFKKPGYALMAMLPLVVGIFWMVGIMHLLGLKLTVMNVMGLPLIIGIGIDDGVHIIHRWINEGKHRMDVVFSSTGKAILLTSMTTMLGFGSLVFSIWRGFGQLGSALFIGVAACFLTTVLILPGIMGLIHKEK